ncbi:hypothetical protein FB550_11530 [Neobacillus bataviensis]|uniref:Uncharacterized protein n=1 Tax=Neobacillus bataviensis TaxID=220685 RepID=A0A561CQ84_9BACI|nr:hypothetical protein FB550_11530 [Neobacillus bataviensis]
MHNGAKRGVRIGAIMSNKKNFSDNIKVPHYNDTFDFIIDTKIYQPNSLYIKAFPISIRQFIHFVISLYGISIR